MQKRFLLKLFLFFFSFSQSFGQNSYSITGTVKDKVSILPGASIYVSGYKIGSITNDNGFFSINKLAPGSYDIMVYMIGYLPYAKKIIIKDKSQQIEVILKDNVTLLKEVVIRPDKDRTKFLALFNDFFIGKTINAKQCKILNPSVLNIEDDKENELVRIRATDFIVIENLALGYKIKYLLTDFEYNYKTNKVFYSGYPHFEEIKGNNSIQKKWVKNREICYRGSQQHFFKSLYNNNIIEQDFLLYKLQYQQNPNKKSDSLVKDKIAQIKAWQKQNPSKELYDIKEDKDSLYFWIQQQSVPRELAHLLTQPISMDTLVKTYEPNLKTINFNDYLYIVYKGGIEEEGFSSSTHRQFRPNELINFQVSTIMLLHPNFNFYANGSSNDFANLYKRGYWAYKKIADLVPLDYKPLKN